MSSNKKNDKFNREKCRQELAKRYNNEINELKDRVTRLEEEKIVANKLIEQQKEKIEKQEEQINLYKMVVSIPEKDLVMLLKESKTKMEFLDAVNTIGKIFGR